jgi:hypothetical protein
MRAALIAFLVLTVSGCSQYKRLIGQEPYEEDIPPCSRVPAQDFSGTDEEVMDELLFDQRNRLDNTSQFFDNRPVSLQTVRDLYNGVKPFPKGPAYFSCLDEPDFRRVVEAADNLGRFPL